VSCGEEHHLVRGDNAAAGRVSKRQSKRSIQFVYDDIGSAEVIGKAFI
jgi:hypothetical protein